MTKEVTFRDFPLSRRLRIVTQSRKAKTRAINENLPFLNDQRYEIDLVMHGNYI